MKIVDEKELAKHRGSGLCEFCGRWCDHREAAHIQAKQIGGGARVDHRFNLVALGCSFCCGCHRESHAGNRPLTCDLEAVVAAREGLLQGEIRDWMLLVRSAPKDGPIPPEPISVIGLDAADADENGWVEL